MWLIDVSTRQLQWWDEGKLPKYAILSHVWSDDEVSFRDYKDGNREDIKSSYGWWKIDLVRQQAEKERIQYIWVDTCCIDKSSSAELSEAVNSMLRWYCNAVVCYALLDDFGAADNTGGGYAPHSTSVYKGKDKDTRKYPSVHNTICRAHELAKCRWFGRGWTLQELIAPRRVEFYTGHWAWLGSREDIVNQLHSVTGIDTRVLDWPRNHASLELSDEADEAMLHTILNEYSVAQRLSWASRRATTRVEDQAYALMGIFDVNMPLLYGEGSKAFIRLQEEIMKTSTDQSLLAWSIAEGDIDHLDMAVLMQNSLFAPSPKYFQAAQELESRCTAYGPQSFELTNLGLRIHLPSIDTGDGRVFVLACGPARECSLITMPFSMQDGLCYLHRDRGLGFAQPAEVGSAQSVTIVRKSDVQHALPQRRDSVQSTHSCQITVQNEPGRLAWASAHILQTYPSAAAPRDQDLGFTARTSISLQLSVNVVAVRLHIRFETGTHHRNRNRDIFLKVENREIGIGVPYLASRHAPERGASLGSVCDALSQCGVDGLTWTPYGTKVVYTTDDDEVALILRVSVDWKDLTFKARRMTTRDVHIALERPSVPILQSVGSMASAASSLLSLPWSRKSVSAVSLASEEA